MSQCVFEKMRSFQLSVSSPDLPWLSPPCWSSPGRFNSQRTVWLVEQSRVVQLPPGISSLTDVQMVKRGISGLTSLYPQTAPAPLSWWRPVWPGPGGPALPPPRPLPTLLPLPSPSPGVIQHQGGDEGGLLSGLQVYQAGSWGNSVRILPRIIQHDKPRAVHRATASAQLCGELMWR